MKTLSHKRAELDLLKRELPMLKVLRSSPDYTKKSARSMKVEKPKLFEEIIEIPKTHLRFFQRSPDKSSTNPSPDRLFKQNLKNIIRKKISYETREFAVLKFFRRGADKKQIKNIPAREEDHPIVDGPINRFFNFA